MEDLNLAITVLVAYLQLGVKDVYIGRMQHWSCLGLWDPHKHFHFRETCGHLGLKYEGGGGGW
jgi:hypothetical protein